MKKIFNDKVWGKLFFSVLFVALIAGFGLYAPAANAASSYTVTETTATVGTATNLEIEYTVDSGVQTWADGDTLTITLPNNFPIWSSMTMSAEYDTDTTNNGVGETPIAQGAGNGEYSHDGQRVLTIKWNVTGWGAVVDDASTIRILVTADAVPMYEDATSTFTFGGTTAAGGDTNPSSTDDVNVSAADPNASIDVSAIDTVGETGNVVATFDIDYPLVNNDQVWITFPANYDVSGATYVSDTFTGDFDTCAVAGQTVKCDANGGIASQGSGTITISGIKAKYEAAASTYTTALYDVSATSNISSASDDAIGATYAATSFTGSGINASEVTLVGDTAGQVIFAITFPVALAAGDTIKITFPDNYDVSGLTQAAGQNYNLDQDVTVAVAGQVVTLTLSGAQTAGTGEIINFEANKILAKYAATGQTASILIEKSTGQDVLAASTDAGVTDTIENTTAADPVSSINVTAISEYNKTGNTVVSFTIPYALANDDELRLTLPASYNVASAAYVSDTFTGSFDACTAAGQTITCTANGAMTAETATVTISGIRAASNTPADASTYTTTLYDISASAIIATANDDAIAATTADATAPTLDTGNVIANNSPAADTITLQFSENMDETTAENVANYIVTNNGGSITYNIATAVLTNDTVVLTLATVNPADPTTFMTSTDVAAHIKVTPSVNIKDANGVAYGGLQITESGGSLVDATAPTLAAGSIIVNNQNQPNTITLTFSEPMDHTQAETVGNYLVQSNDLGITYGIASAAQDLGGTVITLTLNAVNPADNTTFITNADATAGIKVTPNANLEDVSGFNYAAGLVLATEDGFQDITPPTLPAANIDVNNSVSPNTITLQFSEKLNKTTAEDITHYTVTNNAAGISYTIASAALTNDTVVLTLAAFDKDDPQTYITNAAIAGHIKVTPSTHILDVVGTAYAGALVTEAGGSHTLHSSVPTVTVGGTSVDKAGDTITLTFNEEMDTSTITNAIVQADTNVTLDYSDDAGNTNQANIPLTNATVSWNAAKLVATITLNEATDSAYIPDGKFLGATLSGVTDIYGIAEAGSEVYSGAGIAKEATVPTIVVTANSVNAGGDTITITSDEVLSSTATTIGNWTVQYDDNGAGLNIQTVTLANAVATINAAKTVVTITLDEVTDGASIPSSKYVKVTPNATNIKDLVGNNGVAADYTAAGVSSESTAPTISATSVADGATGVAVNPTISVTFSEALSPATVNSNTVKLYTDVGNNNAVNIGTDTEVPVTISLENNGASTKIYITPNSNLSNSGNYIYRISTGVKDLSGNALAANADYDFTTVAQSNGSLAVTSISTTRSYATADDTWGNGWAWTFNITVPTSETSFRMKFSNWISGSNTIAAANNIRFYSAQASANADADNARLITAAATNSDAIILDGDLDANTAGRQIQVTVEAKVPAGSSGGSYSTSYGVTSNLPS
ncbi:MAG: Ig-like domain-containing protein [Patescibacteria group bacterium]